jgi:hypothetical protein
MLDVYAAWTEGTQDSDIEAIKQAMQSRQRVKANREKHILIRPLRSPKFGTGYPPSEHKCRILKGISWW